MSNYNFETDKWYILNNTTASKLDKGLTLGTKHTPEWFDNEEDWKIRCDELGIEIIDFNKLNNKK